MKILHFSDLHAHKGKIDEAVQALSFVYDTAIKEKVDMLLFTGDFWDRATVNAKDSAFLPVMEKINALCKNFITCWVRGTPSHDLSGSLDIFKYLGKETYVYEEPTAEVLKTSRGEIALLALPEMRNVSHNKFYQKLKEMRGSVEGCLVKKIFAGHVAITECAFDEKFAFQMSRKELLDLKCDYYALGHIHDAHQPSLAKTSARYGGSLYPLTFGEKEEKGLWIVIPGEEITWIKSPAKRVVQFDDIPADSDTTNVKGKRVKIKIRQKPGEIDPGQIESLKRRMKDRGAVEVIVESVVIPQAHVRMPEIVESQQMVDKLDLWCESVGVDCTPLLKKRAQELEAAVEAGGVDE